MGGARGPAAPTRAIWRRLHGWRRISLTGPGAAFLAGILAVGFAALNTGNNLLYLLLGAMLGIVVLSGVLSETTLRRLEVSRRPPRGTPVDQDLVLRYRLRNGNRWIPAFSVEISEEGLAEAAFVPRVGPGSEAGARSVNRFVRRGVYPLERVTLSTAFPFGLFVKSRELPLPGELVIWPRADRRTPDTASGAGLRSTPGTPAGGGRGLRGEYRGLREYRIGDDPRDIHWRSSARLPSPAVREYERDTARDLWVCLDLRGRAGPAAEAAVETAASLVARGLREGRPVGLVAGADTIPAGRGGAHLEAALDLLARVDMDPVAPLPVPPVEPGGCVLVPGPGRGGDGGGFGRVLEPADAPPPPSRTGP